MKSKTMNFQLSFWFEIVAFLIAMVFIKRIVHSKLFYFVPFLLITIVYEYGSRKGWFTIGNSNHTAANFFMNGVFFFYLIFFSSVFKSDQIKRFILFSGIAIAIVFLLNLTFGQGLAILNSYTILFGSLVIIGWSCFSFYKIMNSEDRINVLQIPLFWIATGLLFYYLANFAFMANFNYVMRSKDYQYSTLFQSISNFSNLILYGCIGISFVCDRQFKSKSWRI